MLFFAGFGDIEFLLYLYAPLHFILNPFPPNIGSLVLTELDCVLLVGFPVDVNFNLLIAIFILSIVGPLSLLHLLLDALFRPFFEIDPLWEFTVVIDFPSLHRAVVEFESL